MALPAPARPFYHYFPMNRFLLIALSAILLLPAACVKEQPAPPHNQPADTTTTPVLPVDTLTGFTSWWIRAGQHYAEGNQYPQASINQMRFKVLFDSSCIYTSQVPENQEDINKLMGFSDCGEFHQVSSARFGWNWLRDSLRIHAYCYVNSVRVYKELGAVPLNRVQHCELRVLPESYVFILNGRADTLSRGCTDSLAMGYKLYPYFGGNEPAPHDVRIRVLEY